MKAFGRTVIRFAALALTACGAHAMNQPAAATPARYAGTCTLVGIEEVSAPVDQPDDSVALIARYRFDDRATAGTPPPLELQVQMARASVHDLQLHLESHSTVVCNPDPGASTRDAAHIEVPPAREQGGEPVP